MVSASTVEFTTLFTGKKNEIKSLEVARELNWIAGSPFDKVKDLVSMVAVPAGIPKREMPNCKDSLGFAWGTIFVPVWAELGKAATSTNNPSIKTCIRRSSIAVIKILYLMIEKIAAGKL